MRSTTAWAAELAICVSAHERCHRYDGSCRLWRGRELIDTNQFPDAATQTVVTAGTLPSTSPIAVLFGGKEFTKSTPG
jgi:hypothetical protein